MNYEEIIIRELNESDIKYIVDLNSELGYPSSADNTYKRLYKIMNDNSYKTFVAEKNSMVIGYIGLCKLYAYEYDGEYIRITACVVSRKYRNRGIGSILINAAEKYGENQGVIAITLNSGLNRKEAHEFYKSKDYIIKGYGFSKVLK